MIWSHDWLFYHNILLALQLADTSFPYLLESESEVTQWCLTLCDPMDCSLLGSSLHGISQARVLEWVAISFILLTAIQSLSHVKLFVTQWTATSQASLSFTISQSLEFAQTHIHWVGDAIQPSHPLPPSSFFAFNISQHQGLFQWVSYSYQVAKILEFHLQNQSFQWIFRIDFL